MQLIDFIDACDIASKTEIERFELLCFYLAMEKGTGAFSPKKMLGLYGEAGLAAPDPAAIKKEASKHASFRPYGIEGTLKFERNAFRALEKEYGHLWEGVAVPQRAKANAPRAAAVRLADFADACGLRSGTEEDVFELICYYLARERGVTSFYPRNILETYEDAGIAVPDKPAFEKMAKKHGSFQTVGIDGSVVFRPGVYESVDGKHGHMWSSVQTGPTAAAPSCSEVIDESRFCGKREGFDRLIVQINSSYRSGSFDACAAVMRRLLESALVLAFQTNGADADIANDGRYDSLSDIITKADRVGLLNEQILKDLKDVSGIGDYSGRGPMYTFGANDINSVRLAYRNAIEALFSVSKIL